jgi:putative FmdB family regulatory protein
VAHINREGHGAGAGFPAAWIPVAAGAARQDNPRRQENAMPIYEYSCEACGREFETLVRSGETPACPQCESTRLHKRLSVFATASAAESAPALSPCGSCGHPGGPGSCALH